VQGPGAAGVDTQEQGGHRPARALPRLVWSIRLQVALVTIPAIEKVQPMETVFELRQYTLHPGQRDVLIDLFEQELLEPQEAVGMRIVGQFRDLDRSDHFVWIRGFAEMESRAKALQAFYGGPVWRRHRDAANATMIDSDDVLLLRPARPGWNFASDGSPPPPPRASASLLLATIYPLASPVDDEFKRRFEERLLPILREAGAAPIACLETEPEENNYPALPVRAGENVFVWLAAFESAHRFARYQERLAQSQTWNGDELPDLLGRLASPPQQLRLVPTTRSRLR
jgi:hypothetical protein